MLSGDTRQLARTEGKFMVNVIVEIYPASNFRTCLIWRKANHPGIEWLDPGRLPVAGRPANAGPWPA
jgi:hypothetical protein